MFPIAHAWLIEQIVVAPTPAHYLGCVWPDMLFESPLTHAQSHRSGALLVAHARTLGGGETAEVFRQFIAGVLSHGSEPHGFDWYSDEQYGDAPASARGYAFQQGHDIALDAARACGVSDELGWWKAHNIVEMAFERPLTLVDPTRCDRLASACADTRLIEQISGVLSAFFTVPPEQLAHAMVQFKSIVQLHPTSVTSLADVYALQVRAKHTGAEPDVQAIGRLIARAEELIAPDKDAYLRRCIEWVGDMLRDELS